VNKKTGPYQTVKLPKGRRVVINMLNLVSPKHSMVGLLEVDVTEARQLITTNKEQTGEKISFTGFLTLCLGRAIEEHKEVHAYLKGNKQLIIFDDVNVAVMVEHKTGDKRALMGHVIKGANRKTLHEINDEIRSVQSTPLPPNRGLPTWFRNALLLPGPFFRLFRTLIRWAGRQNPVMVISMGGTVSISSVGMFGARHAGWGIFPATQVIELVVGSIAKKPAVIDERIEPREILHLTVMLDHDVIDGAPAARFVKRLVELIESAYGLREMVEERNFHLPKKELEYDREN
jgi:pyruvate/2-oxoglutarate dehydrogenase complex dihydrolipoamide acyltransferase (E2) component